jgi:hypothetical protein
MKEITRSLITKKGGKKETKKERKKQRKKERKRKNLFSHFDKGYRLKTSSKPLLTRNSCTVRLFYLRLHMLGFLTTMMRKTGCYPCKRPWRPIGL